MFIVEQTSRSIEIKAEMKLLLFELLLFYGVPIVYFEYHVKSTYTAIILYRCFHSHTNEKPHLFLCLAVLLLL